MESIVLPYLRKKKTDVIDEVPLNEKYSYGMGKVQLMPDPVPQVQLMPTVQLMPSLHGT